MALQYPLARGKLGTLVFDGYAAAPKGMRAHRISLVPNSEMVTAMIIRAAQNADFQVEEKCGKLIVTTPNVERSAIIKHTCQVLGQIANAVDQEYFADRVGQHRRRVRRSGPSLATNLRANFRPAS